MGGRPKRLFLPLLENGGGGSDPVWATWSLVLLYGPVTQLRHHNSLGQREGCDRDPPPPYPNPLSLSVGSTPFPEQQENSGKSLELNLTQARRMRKHS
ncbi:hypothetical protein NQZ68_003984 [Dissostichus eleginoides]|nr:hypothetical protein NQZ68_003984 [Dissostichus eleginoides]